VRSGHDPAGAGGPDHGLPRGLAGAGVAPEWSRGSATTFVARPCGIW
jgi:hypothetical protein